VGKSVFASKPKKGRRGGISGEKIKKKFLIRRNQFPQKLIGISGVEIKVEGNIFVFRDTGGAGGGPPLREKTRGAAREVWFLGISELPRVFLGGNGSLFGTLLGGSVRFEPANFFFFFGRNFP